MAVARDNHTATLLADGSVLIVGGFADSYLSAVEIYDHSAGTWGQSIPLAYARGMHTASLLRNGKVLVAGGWNGAEYISSSELYEPTSGTWFATGDMTTARGYHTATVLPSGMVLAVGGYSNGNYLRRAEFFDPSTGAWAATGLLNVAREWHTATLLPNGKVLVAGGYNSSGSLTSVELYDPNTGVWTSTSPLNRARHAHTATFLAGGKVLVTGGVGASGSATNSAEIYDPAAKTWTLVNPLSIAREEHTATLLPNGKVLVTGGAGTGYLANSELFTANLGYSAWWQPEVYTITSPLNLGGNLALTGTNFRGISGASGGNTQDSSSDYPVVQLHSIESGQTMFLQTTNWSTNSFTSLPVWNFPPGWAMATVFVNGIPSTSRIVNITVPNPTPPTIADAKKLTNGAVQFTFTNRVGAVFGALVSTNVSLPLSNWTALSGVTEVSPGQFQFTDPQATNSPRRFYRVRAN